MKLLGYTLLFVVVMFSTLAILGQGPQAADSPEGTGTMTTQKKDTVKPDPSKPRYSKSGYDITPLTQTRIDELAKKLAPADAEVILAKGTERAFCGNLYDNHKDGVYICKLCGLPLFSSGNKFDSGTGWPSFFQPVDNDHVVTHRDTSLGMIRDEILCVRCGAHLGHVFDDGPRPTGLRFCVNSASLDFVEKGQPMPPASKPVESQVAYFAGGCFWGVEDYFAQVPGVIDAVSGYMGGKTKNPTYDQVCAHDTHHAETVQVRFDPKRVTFAKLLEVFFQIHDPTQLNRQGPDFGDQYRSAIFAASNEQAKAARAFIAEQQKSNPRFEGAPIVTEVIDAGKDGPVDTFYKAEEYHQDYHLKHGGSCALPAR